ncbi:MAG: ATP-binding protein [Anaerolineaceae bacterium]|nr:ATP-binding protein [Anaerolineaceae bacterium]
MPISDFIGYVVGGSLTTSLQVRLTVSPEKVQEGSFVVIEGDPWIFYGLVVDLRLGSTDPRFADEQFETRVPDQIARMLLGQTLYTNAEVMPVLMQEAPAVDELSTGAKAGPGPVKTVPKHHDRVRLAHAGDIAAIFGAESEPKNFTIGYTREQGHPVVIDLEKFVQRSSGIFGATGTGKSFLTRMILAGLVQYDHASVLLFDMHNEYGFDDIASDTKTTVFGLASKFKSKVRVTALGRGAQIHGFSPDFNLEIAERDIEPADILLLAKELDLNDTADSVLGMLYASFGNKWFSEFRGMQRGKKFKDEEGKEFWAPDSVEAWAEKVGAHPSSAAALHRRLDKLFQADYIVEQPAADSLGGIIDSLQNDKHMVLSFGKHERDLDYLFVANIITRRIRDAWVRATDAFRSDRQKNKEPRPLVIVIEEAHKLLNREMGSQTIFSTIARELRKYFVTLLVVDQRPSQIYDEVMSQLGTRISGWLGDDTDIGAVLSGLASKDKLRGMLSHLQEKEEVLLLGWGVPMPLPVRSRRYDQQFWDDLLGKKANSGKDSVDDLKRGLGF